MMRRRVVMVVGLPAPARTPDGDGPVLLDLRRTRRADRVFRLVREMQRLNHRSGDERHQRSDPQHHLHHDQPTKSVKGERRQP